MAEEESYKAVERNTSGSRPRELFQVPAAVLSEGRLVLYSCCCTAAVPGLGALSMGGRQHSGGYMGGGSGEAV